MKYIIALLALFILAPMRASDLLAVVAQIETGGDPSVVGPAGERSSYQMTQAVWQIYTSEPFARASSDPFLALQVAQAHLQYLTIKLRQYGIAPTPAKLALAWHSGLGAAYSARSNTEQTDYVRRFTSLFASQDLWRAPGHN
jgi:hypothetical protein